MSRSSERVQIRKGDAPRTATRIGPVGHRPGSGCGAFGALGTYEGAMAEMKDQAAAIGASYVRLDSRRAYLTPTAG